MIPFLLHLDQTLDICFSNHSTWKLKGINYISYNINLCISYNTRYIEYIFHMRKLRLDELGEKREK